MSNKRRLMEYRDALEEANIPPSKMRKVNLGLSESEQFKSLPEGEISSSDDEEDDEYEDTDDEDMSEDESGFEGVEENFEDNLVLENEHDLEHMTMNGDYY